MSELSVYEKLFAKTDKTDAILVIDKRKLHVNKALLSCHSAYFDALFNSEFKEKPMKEIEIKDVHFVHFAVVLSLVHKNPIRPKLEKAEELLKMADRFDFSAATHYLDCFIGASDMSRLEKLKLADKYNLDLLSCHSNYFDALFNSEFKEKSMDEIEIKDVNFEDFAVVLSLVHKNAINPTKEKVETLLKLADQFDLPAATRFLDCFICSTDINREEKLRLADQYKLENLLVHALKLYEQKDHILFRRTTLRTYSDRTKARIAERLFDLHGKL
uniref:BTB domain-containing protein n=1 Tax=Caenorhabditis tropicalis TaxID=1561998 RepID=A0A1I7UI54_9PELO